MTRHNLAHDPTQPAGAATTDEAGGVVIEYGIVVATIVLLLVAAAGPFVTAVQTFFAGLPAGLP